jgi:hypothetical protein
MINYECTALTNLASGLKDIAKYINFKELSIKEIFFNGIKLFEQ